MSLTYLDFYKSAHLGKKNSLYEIESRTNILIKLLASDCSPYPGICHVERAIDLTGAVSPGYKVRLSYQSGRV